jgi:hypothetical protein
MVTLYETTTRRPTVIRSAHMKIPPTRIESSPTSRRPVGSKRISDYGTGSSADGSKELFFDNLLLTAPGIPGDSNQDNKVDAADYAVWRKNELDATAYELWRSHFGQSSTGSASLTASLPSNVPEPSGTTLTLIASALSHLFVRRQIFGRV